MNYVFKPYLSIIPGWSLSGATLLSLTPGTREEKSKKNDDVPWYSTLWRKMKQFCPCCRAEPSPSEPPAVSTVNGSNVMATAPLEVGDSARMM